MIIESKQPILLRAVWTLLLSIYNFIESTLEIGSSLIVISS